MNELAIHDPYCAAFLAASGVNLKRIEPGRYTQFVFDDSDWRARDVLGIWKSNRGQVNITAYVRCLKQFRTFTINNKQPMNGEMSNGNSKQPAIRES